MRLTLRVIALGATLFMVSATVNAVSFSSFDYGGATELRLDPNVIRRWNVDPELGVIDQYVSQVNSFGAGGANWITTTAGAHGPNVNTGVTLGSAYTAELRGTFYLKGQITCVSPASQGQGTVAVHLRVRAYDNSISTRPLVGEKDITAVTCVGSMIRNIDSTFEVVSSPITWKAGHEYDIQGDLRPVISVSDKGSATSDFSDDGQGRLARLVNLRVPDQSPIVTLPWSYVSQWWGDNIVSGPIVHMDACDYDGVIASATITIEPTTAIPPTASGTTGRACSSAQVAPRFLVPQRYTIRATAADEEGAQGFASAIVDIALFPAASSNVMVDILGRTNGDQTTLVVHTDRDGSVKSVYLSHASFSEALADSKSLSTASEHILVSTFDESAGVASIALDGKLLWEGLGERVGPEWWQVHTQDFSPKLD